MDDSESVITLSDSSRDSKVSPSRAAKVFPSRAAKVPPSRAATVLHSGDVKVVPSRDVNVPAPYVSAMASLRAGSGTASRVAVVQASSVSAKPASRVASLTGPVPASLGASFAASRDTTLAPARAAHATSSCSNDDLSFQARAFYPVIPEGGGDSEMEDDIAEAIENARSVLPMQREETLPVPERPLYNRALTQVEFPFV